jgi:hypothetical protein
VIRRDQVNAVNPVMSTAHPRRTSVFTLFVLLLALSIVFGCSKSEPTPVPVAPQITAAEAVEMSKSAMADLQSFSFELTHDSGFTSLSGSLELTRASGVVAPNGLDLEAEANIGRAFVRVEAVVIDDRTWMTNPLTGVWSEIPPEDSPFSFLDPVKLVADILGETQGASYPSESITNDDIVVSGQITAPTLAALVGTVDQDAVPDVVLTLDSSEYLLKRIVISGKVQPSDEPTTVRVITLSEFDKQVSLEPPI